MSKQVWTNYRPQLSGRLLMLLQKQHLVSIGEQMLMPS